MTKRTKKRLEKKAFSAITKNGLNFYQIGDVYDIRRKNVKKMSSDEKATLRRCAELDDPKNH